MTDERGMFHGSESHPPGPRRFWLALVLVAIWLAPAPCPGRTLGGITLPDRIEVAGTRLQLVGLGRWRRFFDTRYLVGLYLVRPPKSEKAALRPNQIKQLRIEFPAKNLTRSRFVDGLNQGLYDNNPPATLAKLAPQIKKFLSLLSKINTARHGRLVLTYLPREGTTVYFNRRKLGVIEGHQFMTALFSVWLGENPVSAGLKRHLLGGRP
jgi:hypothetical protein